MPRTPTTKRTSPAQGKQAAPHGQPKQEDAKALFERGRKLIEDTPEHMVDQVERYVDALRAIEDKAA